MKMKPFIKNRESNIESVIRYYLLFLPPRGVKSILDIGCGTTAPYRGLLRKRCERYTAFDIRLGKRVNVTGDLCSLPFKNKKYEWGWCVETIEHLKQKDQQKAIDEILRVCKNAVVTFPTPSHPSFDKDPTHNEVILDFSGWIDKSTKTGRCIFIRGAL